MVLGYAHTHKMAGHKTESQGPKDAQLMIVTVRTTDYGLCANGTQFSPPPCCVKMENEI